MKKHLILTTAALLLAQSAGAVTINNKTNKTAKAIYVKIQGKNLINSPELQIPLSGNPVQEIPPKTCTKVPKEFYGTLNSESVLVVVYSLDPYFPKKSVTMKQHNVRNENEKIVIIESQ